MFRSQSKPVKCPYVGCNLNRFLKAIYLTIILFRSQSKPVKCPYVGCNQRDFTKKDLLKDK